LYKRMKRLTNVEKMTMAQIGGLLV
jgi:hypothetical protein